MVKKRVIILGGGAIGSILAAAISQKPDVNLKMIGRKGHITRINTHGLEIGGQLEEKEKFKIHCFETIDFSLDHTLVIFAAKATDLQSSIKQILETIDNTTQFLIIQNGLGIEEIILNNSESKVISENLFRGIVGFGATFLDNGKVNYWQGKFIVEKRFAESPYSDIFNHTFLQFFFTGNIKKLVWKKVIINSIYNPLSVILKVRNNVIAEERFNKIKEELLKEGIMVALSEGINPGIDLHTLNKIVSSNNITSMLQDHLKGKPGEIEFINGAIVKIGEKNNIKTPVNDYIVHLIKAIEFIRKENLTVF
jgi:2-dehydropantoate 2-reductase